MQYVLAAIPNATRAVRILALLSVLIPFSVFIFAAASAYDRHYKETENWLLRSTEVLREHAIKVFETHKLASQQVDEILFPRTDQQIREAEATIHPRLKQLVESLPQIEDIWVLDKEGRPLVAASSFPAPNELSLTDREYYQVHRDGKIDAGKTYVSEVLRGRYREGVFFQLSTGRYSAGQFAGVTAVSVQPQYFHDFYRSVALTGITTTALVREDGVVLSRYPIRIEELPNVPKALNLVEEIKKKPIRGIFQTTSLIDGFSYIASYHRLPNYPVYVTASIKIDTVTEAWREEIFSWLLIGIPLTLALVGLSLTALVFTHKEAKTLAQLQEQIALREEQEFRVRQLQKMEAVGQLTGGIAHDFNNLLTIVIGSLDMIRRNLARGDKNVQRYLDAASEGAQRGAKLTQRLLAFARKQPLEPKPTDANRLLSGMADLVRTTLGEQVELEIVLAGGLWQTNVDANQLENAILNLAVNARDAMPQGGKLTLETANSYLDDRYTNAEPDVPPGQYILISVTDTGVGMTSEIVAKAVEPFFTTKPDGQGTGLGLSQVFGFVKQSGGHLKIYSEVGHGTTIKIYMPRYFGSDAPVQTITGTLPRSPLKGMETILIVEDEDAVRSFSKAALEEYGYKILDADCGATALKIIDLHPEIALLFTDIVMPGMNGRDLAKEAQSRLPHLKVLYTTGYSRNAIIHNGVLDPDVALINKPFTLEEVAKKVRQVLDS